MGAVRLDTREKMWQRKLMKARLRPSGGSVARSVPFIFVWPADHDHSTPAFNATRRPHCVWKKPFLRTGRPFRRGGDPPCDDHNKGQDLFGHHNPPVYHRTLQAFYLRAPSEPEATWDDDRLLRDGEESVTSRVGRNPFLHDDVRSDRRGSVRLSRGRLYNDHPGNGHRDAPDDRHGGSYQDRAAKGNKNSSPRSE